MTCQMILDYYVAVVCSNVCSMLPMKLQILEKKSIYCNILQLLVKSNNGNLMGTLTATLQKKERTTNIFRNTKL